MLLVFLGSCSFFCFFFYSCLAGCEVWIREYYIHECLSSFTHLGLSNWSFTIKNSILVFAMIMCLFECVCVSQQQEQKVMIIVKGNTNTLVLLTEFK